MKKIGFIDNFLSEAHANTYPVLLREKARAKELGLVPAYAWAKTEVSPYDGVTTDQWCEKFGIARCATIEELVEASDCIVVLSPDNPELHEQLAECALRSGKRTYIDKTFAPDKAAAIRMFDLAKKHGTPMYSSSALRFAKEMEPYRLSDVPAKGCVATGPYLFDIYAIHIFEMMVTAMKSGAKRMMAVQNSLLRNIVVEYEDGRHALYNQMQAGPVPFQITVEKQDGTAEFHEVPDGYFERFVDAMIEFFGTGEVQVPAQETIDLMGMLDAARKALAAPFTWVEI